MSPAMAALRTKCRNTDNSLVPITGPDPLLIGEDPDGIYINGMANCGGPRHIYTLTTVQEFFRGLVMTAGHSWARCCSSPRRPCHGTYADDVIIWTEAADNSSTGSAVRSRHRRQDSRVRMIVWRKDQETNRTEDNVLVSGRPILEERNQERYPP